MQNVTPFLWLNNQAEEAATLYTSLFPDSKIEFASRQYVTYELAGQKFMALNGGPMFTMTPSVSFFVYCETVEEIDRIWEKLSQGGKVMMELQQYPFSEKYGWLNDKYGVSWQLMVGEAEHKVTPFLFFTGKQNGKAEEAVNYYVSVFNNSSIGTITYYQPGMGEPEKAVVHADFVLAGQPFMAMENSGPHAFTFSEANSFFIGVETQAEVDELWEKLSQGGSKGQCGWLKDKYGLSWQVIPKKLSELLAGESEKAGKVYKAMLTMTKLDIAQLQEAYDQD
ncbi:MAG: VOC family protein [Patescibacteria group bacterium]